MRGDKDGDFIVFRHDHDEEKEEDLHYRIDCHDPAAAAVLAAEKMHAERDGWEWTWPVQFVVTNDLTNQRWLIEVERESVPEFYQRGKPKDLPPRPPPSTHGICKECKTVVKLNQHGEVEVHPSTGGDPENVCWGSESEPMETLTP